MNARKVVVLATVPGALLIGMVVIAALARDPILDKSGTKAVSAKSQGSQVASDNQLTSLGSFEAERGGFEPPVPLRRLRFSRPALV
jgi:hypothetical protein